jgi:Lrp/AsnC family transcriptional regulator, regulator for asnA, asnC and gidA
MDAMDPVDDQLVKLLEQNAWQRSEALARKLGVSAATVRRRLRRLSKTGILRAVAIADVSRTGLSLTAVIALNIKHRSLDTVTRALASLPEVKWVATTTGRFDILTLARFRSTGDLSEFIRKHLTKVQGVRGSETFICLDVSRGDHVFGAG